MINARILVRKGLKADFDPTKMLPGEWAVSIDASTSNQIVWMCFAPGVCKRMGTYEDFQNMVYNATGQIIERYEDAFGSILEEVNTNAEAVSANTDIVLVAKSDIINTYLPQIKSYVSNASASASEAKTYSENASASASEADKSAEDAKKYSQNAFSTTPAGYEVLVGDVDLLKNSIIQTTDRTLYGSNAGGIKLISIGGASEQKQYSGKNLLDVSTNTKYVLNNDGTTEYSESHLLSDYIQTDGDITLSIKGYSGTPWLRIGLYDSDKNFISRSIVEVTASVMSLTVNNSGYVRVCYENTVEDVQVEVGTTATDYEPYVGATASPNPNYPQEIESVGDIKNLLDTSKLPTTTKYDVTLTNLGDGGLLIDGTPSSGGILVSYSYSREDTLKLLREVGDYLLTNGGCSGGWVYIKYGTAEANYNSPTLTITKENLENETYCLTVGFYVSGNLIDMDNVKLYPMLRKASVSNAEYKPYGYSLGIKASNEDGTKSKSITIPLNEPLREGDEIAVVDGVWGVLHGKGKEVVDENTDITVSGASNGRYRITVTALYGKVAKASSNEIAEDLMCTHYGAIPASETYNGTQGIGLSTGGNIMIFDNKFTTADISLYKAWLAENPIEILYPLATPTFEPFTDQTPFYGLESFDTVTYISTDSEVEPSIELKFAKTEGDAVTLLNYNQTNLNRIAIAELTSAVLALNQE